MDIATEREIKKNSVLSTPPVYTARTDGRAGGRTGEKKKKKLKPPKVQFDYLSELKRHTVSGCVEQREKTVGGRGTDIKDDYYYDFILFFFFFSLSPSSSHFASRAYRHTFFPVLSFTQLPWAPAAFERTTHNPLSNSALARPTKLGAHSSTYRELSPTHDRSKDESLKKEKKKKSLAGQTGCPPTHTQTHRKVGAAIQRHQSLTAVLWPTTLRERSTFSMFPRCKWRKGFLSFFRCRD